MWRMSDHLGNSEELYFSQDYPGMPSFVKHDTLARFRVYTDGI